MTYVPPVPDSSIPVLEQSAANIDEFATGVSDTYTDRGGIVHKTVEGVIKGAEQDIASATAGLISDANAKIEAAIINAGYVVQGTFTTGATLTEANDVIQWTTGGGGSGEYYRWGGSLPKAVPTLSNPNTTGGFGPEAWILAVSSEGLTPKVINLNTLSEAQVETSLVIGDSINLKERSTGNGGGALWDAVDDAVYPSNGFDIVSSAIAGINLKLRVNDAVYSTSLGITTSIVAGAVFERGVELARSLRVPFVLDKDLTIADKTPSLTLEQGDPIVIKGLDDSLVTITTNQATGISIASADPAVRGWFEKVLLENFRIDGNGITTDTGISVYGAAYANTQIRNIRTRGFNINHLDINQCWAIEVINSQIGFGTNSRTTSGSIGINVTNANAFILRDSIISSIGLDFDGTGIKCTSAESVSINDNTIENMQTYIDITSGSGSVSIGSGGTNYFENSTTVQGLIDVTQAPIKLGSAGKLYNADVSNNWFLVANNAINVDFINVSKGRFSQNTHNPNFANDGYWKAGPNSTDIIVENNKRIFLPIDGVSGVTSTDVLNTLNAANELDKDSLFYAADQFIVDTTEPNTPTAGTKNGATTWDFAAGQDAEVTTFIMPPQNWGKCRVKTYGVYSIDSTSTDDIVFFAIPTVIQADGTEVNPSTISFVKDLSTVVAADAPFPNTFANNWIVQRQTREEGVKLRFKRSGTNVSDTFAGVVTFYGMVIERAPNIV